MGPTTNANFCSVSARRFKFVGSLCTVRKNIERLKLWIQCLVNCRSRQHSADEYAQPCHSTKVNTVVVCSIIKKMLKNKCLYGTNYGHAQHLDTCNIRKEWQCGQVGNNSSWRQRNIGTKQAKMCAAMRNSLESYICGVLFS